MTRLNILITAVWIIVGFVAIELAYREYLKLRYHKDIVIPVEIGRFDPYLGWSLIPNSSGISEKIGVIEYSINSKGLRDDEHEYGRNAERKRIVIIGDSRTFGFGVPIEKHFTRLLEGYCAKTDVINLGVAGYGVDQELLYLQSEGIKYDPDLVIAYVAHYGDHRHMHSVRFGQSKPKFELRGEELSLVNHQVAKISSEGRPVLYSAALQRMAKLFDEQTGEIEQNQDKIHDLENSRDPKFMAELHDLGNAIILEMKRFSNKHGANFLLVSQIPDLIAFSRTNNIHVLDVRDALHNDHFQLPDGLAHINESGNGVLAWEIRKFIRSNGLAGC